jgi:hypothetical protein
VFAKLRATNGLRLLQKDRLHKKLIKHTDAKAIELGNKRVNDQKALAEEIDVQLL